MSLEITVGYLADLKVHEPESTSDVIAEFEVLSNALVHAGLEQHHEPEDLDEISQFSCQMWGYSGLHYLRRIAAYDALSKGLPARGDENASEDPVVAGYYAKFTGQPSFFAKLFGAATRPNLANQRTNVAHQHLMLHSDAEGYYVPQDFESVIFPPDNLVIPGGMIGSTNRLYRECRRLAELLGIPEGLDPEDDEVLEAANTPKNGEEKWKEYGVETFCCTRLLVACEFSLRTGAAIVFC